MAWLFFLSLNIVCARVSLINSHLSLPIHSYDTYMHNMLYIIMCENERWEPKTIIVHRWICELFKAAVPALGGRQKWRNWKRNEWRRKIKQKRWKIDVFAWIADHYTFIKTVESWKYFFFCVCRFSKWNAERNKSLEAKVVHWKPHHVISYLLHVKLIFFCSSSDFISCFSLCLCDDTPEMEDIYVEHLQDILRFLFSQTQHEGKALLFSRPFSIFSETCDQHDVK